MNQAEFVLEQPRPMKDSEAAEAYAAAFDRDGIFLHADGGFPAPAEVGGGEWRIVGHLGKRPVAVALDVPQKAASPEVVRLLLRDVYSMIGDAERDALARARISLHHWKFRRFCGACGAPTKLLTTECALRCTQCGAMYFPVIAPAVITLVRRGDELLLAHNAKFAEGMYSLIAGFVEAGESLEHAVAREIREEVGIEVDHIRYFGSSSWPFPNSLMTGFYAEYASGDLRPDGVEITDCAWFRPNRIPRVPRPGSIARELIDSVVSGNSTKVNAK